MDYLGTLNLSMFPAVIRRRLAREDVPRLLTVLAEAGIRVHCGHDLAVIPQVQAQHPKRPRLYELANPALHPNTSIADTFVLHFTRIDTGADVACAACRLRWVEGSLASAYTSKRLLLDVPNGPGGEYRIDTPVAHRLVDFHAAVTTGLTILPGYDLNIVKALLRLLHLWVMSEWQFGWYVAIAPEKVAKQWSLAVEGYSSVNGGVEWKRPTPEHPEGLWTPYYLVLAEREHWRQLAGSPRISDLSISLSDPDPVRRNPMRALLEAAE